MAGLAFNAKCTCGNYTPATAYPVVCRSCQKVIHKPDSVAVVGGILMAPRVEAPKIEVRMDDPVNSPLHYRSHPSGIEAIQITEHMGFCLGNAIKYIWRADLKADAIEDLEKSIWYIRREIDKRKGAK